MWKKFYYWLEDDWNSETCELDWSEEDWEKFWGCTEDEWWAYYSDSRGIEGSPRTKRWGNNYLSLSRQDWEKAQVD